MKKFRRLFLKKNLENQAQLEIVNGMKKIFYHLQVFKKVKP